MYTLKINNEIIRIPSSWNELTSEQLLTAISLSKKNLSLGEYTSRLLLNITGLIPIIKKEKINSDGYLFYFRYGKKKYLIDATDFSAISRKLGFLFNQENDNYYFNYNLTRNLLPKIRISLFKTLYGPADTLTNFLFEEFIHSETNLNYFERTKDPKYLDKLIAVMYRPRDRSIKINDKNYHGDIRESFNDHRIEKISGITRRMDDIYKKAILLFYNGCRRFITSRFPNTFSETSPGNGDIFMSFMKLVNALSESDVTKKDQVRKSYLYDVLITMEELAIQRKKLLKK